MYNKTKSPFISNKIWVVGAILTLLLIFIPNIDVTERNIYVFSFVYPWESGAIAVSSLLAQAVVAILCSTALSILTFKLSENHKATAFLVIGFILWVVTASYSLPTSMFTSGSSASMFDSIYMLALGGAITASTIRIKYPSSRGSKMLGSISASIGSIVFLIAFFNRIDSLDRWMSNPTFNSMIKTLYHISLILWVLSFLSMLIILANTWCNKSARTIARVALLSIIACICGAFLSEAIASSIHSSFIGQSTSFYSANSPSENFVVKLLLHCRRLVLWGLSIGAIFNAVSYWIKKADSKVGASKLVQHEIKDQGIKVKAEAQTEPDKLTKFCPNCGEEIKNTDRGLTYCRFCGYKYGSQ